MGEMTLHAFSGVTGDHLMRLPYLSASWSESLNEDGSMTAKVAMFDGHRDVVTPYKTVLALVDGDTVVHAGYVKRAPEDGGAVNVSCGGFMTILSKRLVINHLLDSSWTDGQVLVDEDHPAGNWPLHFRGTYSDIVRGLLVETLKFGRLPVAVAALQGGTSHERTYNSYDLATVESRISDIADLQDGPEIRFDPVLSGSWNLSFVQRTEDEIVDHHWRWNSVVPGGGCTMGKVDSDGSGMATQVFGAGGKSDDYLLVSMRRSDVLTKRGWPVMQVADKSHSSVSDIRTLAAYVGSGLAKGSRQPRTYGLTVDGNPPVKPGDWADVRTEQGLLQLKVTDVSGDSSGGKLSVQAQDRW